MNLNLKTQRLALRPITAADLEQVHALHAMPEIDRYNTMGIPDSIAVTKNVLDNWLREQQADPQVHYVFHISGQDGAFAGLFGLRLGKPAYRVAEIWYKFHPDFWGRGYATEAVGGILSFGFNDLQLHRIEAGCAVDNIASIRVLEKGGMQREGRCRKILPIRGEWHDNYKYAILEEDFFK